MPFFEPLNSDRFAPNEVAKEDLLAIKAILTENNILGEVVWIYVSRFDSSINAIVRQKDDLGRSTFATVFIKPKAIAEKKNSQA